LLKLNVQKLGECNSVLRQTIEAVCFVENLYVDLNNGCNKAFKPRYFMHAVAHAPYHMSKVSIHTQM